ncbi:hypothetical protein AN2V17_17050 [Vallitalea sp. AN17-2]|uniref:Uncharacterized protein n=2 Tax=Vallitalea maricola TaxID=3074433 RepID=A0ACB5UKN5_9FIRM|nr:hypothetical protein AN2V17_17050 [Vallitalea sp. AN17-2]
MRRFIQLVERDGTELLDTKRKSLFYIVAGNDDLFNKLYQIYDFDKRVMRKECVNNNQLYDETSIKLLKLVYVLIKEDDDSLINPLINPLFNLFHGLDDFNFELALSDIKIRYMGKFE